MPNIPGAINIMVELTCPETMQLKVDLVKQLPWHFQNALMLLAEGVSNVESIFSNSNICIF